MDEDQDGSVTRWIGHLKEGDSRAVDRLWSRYFHRVVALARAKLGQAPRGAADEEDAALSAFRDLCEGAARGRFDRLRDRDDLWHLLVVITVRKVVDLKKYQSRLRRGGGKALMESALGHDDLAGVIAALEQVAGSEPSPDVAAMLAEEYRIRLDTLGDESLRRVALLRLEGYDYEEIASRLGCARRTVARKLEGIRAAWAEGGTDDR